MDPATGGAFLDHAEEHDIALYPLFALILHRSLRRGEAVGLTDTAVDLDNSLISVTQQMATQGYTPVIKKVKSESGNRIMARASITRVILRAHDLRHCAATYLKAAGADLKDIQELLDHSFAAAMTDVYTSVIAELDVKRAKAEAATEDDLPLLAFDVDAASWRSFVDLAKRIGPTG
ncbi:tyrosine-type recombinase/integrase [Micromonospora sp. NPDC005197]|uniref:tyrosine-type recombinase/integrase n=1 Tax=unclassified Micromonospora TaxID=2617518 RepID=UPI0033A369DE